MTWINPSQGKPVPGTTFVGCRRCARAIAEGVAKYPASYETLVIQRIGGEEAQNG
jgi:hypothetical protein